MPALPVIDGAGNALVGFRSSAETRQPRLDARIPMPFALIVVTFARVLMVFDRWRGEWELPGGMREPGETARRPRRREYGAIFRCALSGEPRLIVNDEVADFYWWDLRSPCRDGMSPIDAEIARRVFDC